MKIRSGTIGKGTLPVLAAAFLCTGTQAQIVPGGYTCTASFVRTNNLSLDITVTAGTCTLPVEMAHWFDLSADAELSDSYVTLKCVDFSMWGTTNPADQLISVRVFQDLTPLSSDSGAGSCDDQVIGYDGANEPGPDLGGALLLGEDETFIPIGTNPPVGPRLDGDRSIEFTGPQGGGILLEPDIAFFVVIAHAGESGVQFGGNSFGEVGDSTTGAPGGATGGPQQTWVRPFNCSVVGGVCSQTGDWVKAVLYYGTGVNMDTVMQIHLDLNDTRDPPQLAFDCRQDIAPFDVDSETGAITIVGDNQVNVSDLLALLGSWGQIAPPRPLGDIAPCPTPGADCFGDNKVNVSDLLTLLAAWGPCPNLVRDCDTATETGNLSAQVGEGTFSWVIEAGLIETNVNRPSTDLISNVLLGGVGQCGWANYAETGAGDARNGTGTSDGFTWGDAFGVFNGNLNGGQGGTPPPDAPIVGGDVWFQYTADCNGRAFISATSNCGTGEVVDTILEVYPGDACPNDWTEVLFCNDSDLDPAGCGDFGEVDFVVLQGEKFLIRIAGWFGEIGSGDLNISCVDNSFCAASLPILVNGDSVSANTLNAEIDPAPNCPLSQDTGGRWFSVIGDGNTLTASTCQTAAVELAGGNLNLFDSKISVFCGTNGEVCADLSCVASSVDFEGECNFHDKVSWCTTLGQEYYILVHGNSGVSAPPFFAEGFFILDVTTNVTPCFTAENCGVVRPVNDLCENATVLIPGTTDEFGVSIVSTPTEGRDNNVNALTDGPILIGCATMTRDVWYRYTPNFTSSVVVSTCNLPPVNVDTTIEIYLAAVAECPPVDASGMVECENTTDGCPGGSTITDPIIVFAGQEILIRLGANGGDKQGFYTMTVTATSLVSECAVDPLFQDTCPDGGVLEGGGSGELLLASPPYTTLDISGAAGTFAGGDTVTGVTSGATGDIIALQTIASVDILMLDNVSGAFSAGESVTTGDPLLPDPLTDATATAVAVTDFVLGEDITNGGCNICASPGPQLFGLIDRDLLTDDTPVDVVICGQISTYVSDADLDCAGGLDGFAFELRDTDWFTLNIPAVVDQDGIPSQGGTVTITFASEFSASFGITEATCGATPGDVVPFVASGINGGLCSESTLTAVLPEGDYFVVVTAFNLSGIAVGGTHEGHDYILTVAPIDGGLPFPVVNDECVDAITVLSNDVFLADQRNGATENPDDPFAGCPFINPARHFGSVWYKFVATETTASVQTCDTFSDTAAGFFDSSLIVFSASVADPCDNLTVIDCSEDSCGPGFCPCLSNTQTIPGLIVGDTYYISVGAWSSGDKGIYKVEIISP